MWCEALTDYAHSTSESPSKASPSSCLWRFTRARCRGDKPLKHSCLRQQSCSFSEQKGRGTPNFHLPARALPLLLHDCSYVATQENQLVQGIKVKQLSCKLCPYPHQLGEKGLNKYGRYNITAHRPSNQAHCLSGQGGLAQMKQNVSTLLKSEEQPLF